MLLLNAINAAKTSSDRLSLLARAGQTISLKWPVFQGIGHGSMAMRGPGKWFASQKAYARWQSESIAEMSAVERDWSPEGVPVPWLLINIEGDPARFDTWSLPRTGIGAERVAKWWTLARLALRLPSHVKVAFCRRNPGAVLCQADGYVGWGYEVRPPGATPDGKTPQDHSPAGIDKKSRETWEADAPQRVGKKTFWFVSPRLHDGNWAGGWDAQSMIEQAETAVSLGVDGIACYCDCDGEADQMNARIAALRLAWHFKNRGAAA